MHENSEDFRSLTRKDAIASDAENLDQAVNSLRSARPEFSAGLPIWRWQKWTLAGLPPALLAAAFLAPQQIIFILAAILVVPFFCVVALRATALWFTWLAPRPTAGNTGAVPGLPDDQLPAYSVLVAIYDEADIVPDLVSALAAIDYPRDRLEICLVVESVDTATQRAIQSQSLPSHMHVVVVPDGAPRTKPRALNFALRRANGERIVIYDAEDMPEPDQLRRAANLLATDPKLGCVQARLNVLNDRETWLTRQFAIEYTALFDCILPALDRLELPVPLGGTSNHFTRAALIGTGAWDPFNVTEDADLGIRLARQGWTVKVLASTTWEEAPATFDAWLKQRTRWLKGWMQTYLVHMRQPAKTASDLGWLRFFGLQVLMGGLLLSALVHPWFYIAAIAEAAYGPLHDWSNRALSTAVMALGLVNLVLGYVTGVALGYVAVVNRGRRHLAKWALTMPIYWLLISLAAYRALLQLLTAPYIWEKTPHRPRGAFLPGDATDH